MSSEEASVPFEDVSALANGQALEETATAHGVEPQVLQGETNAWGVEKPHARGKATADRHFDLSGMQAAGVELDKHDGPL